MASMARTLSAMLLALFAVAPPAAAPITLRVLTYNIHHGEGIDGRLDVARQAGVVIGAQPDLVALQEVDQKTERAGGMSELDEFERLTHMYGAFGKAMDYAGGAYGVAVLSKWPLRRVNNRPLPSFDDREPRTALTVETPIGGRGPVIEFTSTHLDQTRDPENRIAQAKYLNDVLARSDGRASILAGDMNSRPGTEVMDLLETRWTNPLVLDPSPISPSGRPRMRVDCVLFRPAATWRVVESRIIDETVASDHRPLLVVFEFHPEQMQPRRLEDAK
jgi:endonuclease/exonuclease/phosphatase family metal-dependent hydrolase